MNNIDLLNNIIKQLEQWCELGIINDTARDIMTIQLNKAIKELELGKVYKEYYDLKENAKRDDKFYQGIDFERLGKIEKLINKIKELENE